jgi:hypothetical protein
MRLEWGNFWVGGRNTGIPEQSRLPPAKNPLCALCPLGESLLVPPASRNFAESSPVAPNRPPCGGDEALTDWQRCRIPRNGWQVSTEPATWRCGATSPEQRTIGNRSSRAPGRRSPGGVSSHARRRQGERVGSLGPGETRFRRGGCVVAYPPWRVSGSPPFLHRGSRILRILSAEAKPPSPRSSGFR